jgi:hypothetical protein
MGISKDSAARILSAGANLRVSGLSKESCLELARIARAQGVQLDIKSKLSADSMVEIAGIGGANVTFDTTD